MIALHIYNTQFIIELIIIAIRMEVSYINVVADYIKAPDRSWFRNFIIR